MRGQCSSLVAHSLSVPGDHGSNVRGNKFPLSFLSYDLMIAVYHKIIHDYAKWSIHEIIHHVWLSMGLNNLYETNWTTTKTVLYTLGDRGQKHCWRSWEQEEDHGLRGAQYHWQLWPRSQKLGPEKGKQCRIHYSWNWMQSMIQYENICLLLSP